MEINKFEVEGNVKNYAQHVNPLERSLALSDNAFFLHLIAQTRLVKTSEWVRNLKKKVSNIDSYQDDAREQILQLFEETLVFEKSFDAVNKVEQQEDFLKKSKYESMITDENLES